MKLVPFVCLAVASILVLESCGKKDPTPVIIVTPPVSADTLVQYGTPFANVPAAGEAVIYQVNIRAFGPNGNFAGVIARLDSIKALGANVVYLMPTYPVGQVKAVNSPYCVRDYLGVNTEFGTLTDLRTIVDGCHARGMAVMMDWVANHTSWDNAWITQHKDWYAQDGSGNIISPPNTNFTDVAQLDFSNSTMKATMIQYMKYWVYTANVDGFRCDYADSPPSSFWTQAVDSLRAVSSHKLLLLAEGSRSANYTSGFDYNFGFNFYGQIKSTFGSSAFSAKGFDNLNTSDYVSASNDQQIVRYITNHDVNSSDGTPLDLYGGINGSTAAFVVAGFMKGVPFIYNGQEVGFPTKITFPFTTVKINWTLNPSLVATYKKLIAYHKNTDAVTKGVLTSYSSADVVAFTKVTATKTVLVIVNVRNSPEDFTLSADLANTTWTNPMNGSATVNLTTDVNLSPYQYFILEK